MRPIALNGQLRLALVSCSRDNCSYDWRAERAAAKRTKPRDYVWPLYNQKRRPRPRVYPAWPGEKGATDGD